MRNSKVLKAICYILIPFLVLAILLPTIYESAKDDLLRNEENSNINFFETDEFLSRYMLKLSNNARNLIFDNDSYSIIHEGETKICYKSDYDEYYKIKDFYYLIIYKNIALTNVELTTSTNTISGIIEFISVQDSQKANIVNGTVDGGSDLIKTKAIQYFDNFIYNYYSIEES